MQESSWQHWNIAVTNARSVPALPLINSVILVKLPNLAKLFQLFFFFFLNLLSENCNVQLILVVLLIRSTWSSQSLVHSKHSVNKICSLGNSSDSATHTHTHHYATSYAWSLSTAGSKGCRRPVCPGRGRLCRDGHCGFLIYFISLAALLWTYF